MTSNADGWIFRSGSRGVETRPVWTEAEATAHGGMTRSAIALRMTRCARLETLSGSLSMSQAEPAEGVMITLRTDSGFRHQTRLLVTSLAELRCVVAVAAVRFASVR